MFLALVLYLPLTLAKIFTTTCVNGPCGPGNDQCGPAFNSNSPQFHIRDSSCSINDPNFPFYDPLHKLYHLFYQDHLAEAQGGNGQGPVIGHAVSADMVYWAHLPVAIWNDQIYDNVAIYTGSATIVNDMPTIVYPGLCNKRDYAKCDTGTVFALALPADYETDPWLTNWVKPGINPVVDNVERDPSTAWQTLDGKEWRFTAYTGQIYSSIDFSNWTVAGDGAALFSEAECPDFFPLPPFCNGLGCANFSSDAQLPTHVHKESSGGQDWYTLGVYSDDAPGSTGTWKPLVGVPALQPLDFSAVMDMGMVFYASKSMFDPVGYRRIFYGWLLSPNSAQSIPRVTQYHAQLQRLVFLPLPELSKLREYPPLYEASGVELQPNSTVWLGDWPVQKGNQSEFRATFKLPSLVKSTTVLSFGVSVMAGAFMQSSGAGQNSSMDISISYSGATRTASLSVIPISTEDPAAEFYMEGTDLPGGDYSVVDVNYTDPHVCQQACADDPRCVAYTYVLRPPLVGSCCLKSIVPTPVASSTCTSGINPGSSRPVSAVPIPLLEGETDIDVIVYVDNTFLEIFVMQGRVVVSAVVTSPIQGTGMALFSRSTNAMSADTSHKETTPSGVAGTVLVSDVNVWFLNSIWKSPEEILKMR